MIKYAVIIDRLSNDTKEIDSIFALLEEKGIEKFPEIPTSLKKYLTSRIVNGVSESIYFERLGNNVGHFIIFHGDFLEISLNKFEYSNE